VDRTCSGANVSAVLDRDQIDTLMASVTKGTDAPRPGADETALLEAAPRPEAYAYDFKRPERVSKEQIRALASIHEVFARNLGATMSGLLRTIVDVRVVGVEQLTYNEFIHSLPNPTCFMILEAPPLEGQMCMEISPLIVYPIVDRLLGGNNTSLYIPQRPLTSIEWRLVQRTMEHALEHLSEVWRNLVDAKFGVVATESNPQLVHIVAPTEVVVFITFEIKLGSLAGTMSLCVPFNTIEAVLSHLATQSWFYKPRPATDQHQQRLLRTLIRGRTTLTAWLGETTIKLSELRSLRPGDVIQLEKQTNQELILQIGGRNKFAGRMGQVRGRRALRLMRPAAIDEPL
jgi:flagellar motor switch protein FliM